MRKLATLLALSVTLMAMIVATAAPPATQPSRNAKTQAATTRPAKPDDEKKKGPFLESVKVEYRDGYMIVESDGIPNHKTGEFPNRSNPNRIEQQRYVFKIPQTPKRGDEITKLPMGPIGVAINGVPFYNPYNREGNNAVEGPFAEAFDSCCGHPDQLGRYHYHKYPTCLKTPFTSKPGEHSPQIGFAFDGYAIYGPLGEDGKEPADLDECNGHTDKARGYHYHVTAKFPYILGGYRGEVDRANFDQRGRFAGGRQSERRGLSLGDGGGMGPPPDDRRRPPPRDGGEDRPPPPPPRD